MAYAFGIRPKEEELLSALLSRVASARGSTPHFFCRLHFKDGWFWTRDLDRGVALRHHPALSSIAGLEEPDLKRLTLRSWIELLAPKHYSERTTAAIVPWVTVAGVKQETRKFYGSQFCPECLASEGKVSRYWRLSFFVFCKRVLFWPAGLNHESAVDT